MHWLEVSVNSPREYAEPIATLFTRWCEGGSVIQEFVSYDPDEGERPPEDRELRVYGYLKPDSHEQLVHIEIGLKLISLLHPLDAIQKRKVNDEEWESEPFNPMRIGRHLVICPPNRAVALYPGDVKVTITMGMAFGTGQHPTTRMMLEEIEEVLKQGDSVLDVGSGSGLLSIVAAKLGASGCLGLDIDSQAVLIAQKNSTLASVQSTTVFCHGSLPHRLVKPDNFDLVMANISSYVLQNIAGDLMQAVKQNGIVLGSGLMSSKTDKTILSFEQSGGQLVKSRSSGEWVLLVLKKQR